MIHLQYGVTVISKDGKCSKCKICSAVLKTLSGSTKELYTHLSAKHSIKVQKESNVTALPSTMLKIHFFLKSGKIMINY